MIKAAIEKILCLSPPTQLAIDGRQYVNQAINAIKPPVQADLNIGTLTGIEDYYRDNPDSIDLGKTVVHIKNHVSVNVVSAVTGEWIQRHEYLAASVKPLGFPYGRYMDAEEFVIAAQTYFVQTDITTKLLQVVGCISDDTAIKVEDDGTSQTVQAKTGIARLSNVTLPNPVMLSPYRTFNELVQPESAFILRLRKGANGPEAAIFEADGGNWQLTAIKLIRDYLRTALPAGTTILA